MSATRASAPRFNTWVRSAYIDIGYDDIQRYSKNARVISYVQTREGLSEYIQMRTCSYENLHDCIGAQQWCAFLTSKIVIFDICECRWTAVCFDGARAGRHAPSMSGFSDMFFPIKMEF